MWQTSANFRGLCERGRQLAKLARSLASQERLVAESEERLLDRLRALAPFKAADCAPARDVSAQDEPKPSFGGSFYYRDLLLLLNLLNPPSLLERGTLLAFFLCAAKKVPFQYLSFFLWSS